MKRSLLTVFSILMVASMALAACAPAVTEAPKATEAPMATDAPLAETPITVTIGFTSSLTGSLEVSSKRQVNGFTLWMNQVNDAGGIHLTDGSVVSFDFVTYDDESNKERVQQLYTSMISDDNADFLISPYSSGLTASAAIIAEQNGMVMITTGAASDDTYKQGYTHVYQLYTPGSLYLKSTVDLVKSFDPAAKIAIVWEAASFTQSVIDGLVPYAESQGFEIVINESYASDTADFSPLINKMVASGATVLLGGGHYADGTTFARQIFDQNVDLDWISLLVAPADSKWPELGDAAAGIATSSQWELAATHTEAEANGLGLDWFGPSGIDFASAYEAMTGDKPTYHVAGGYAAGLILQAAIVAADSVDPEAVNTALEALDIMTFFGGTQFDTSAEAHGLQINHDQIVSQWQMVDGEMSRIVVWPADVALADPLFPYK